MRKVIFLFLSILLPMAASAQLEVVRGDCTPGLDNDDVAAARGMAPRKLSTINTNWDPSKTYHQAVILMTFSDEEFSLENPQEIYNRMFNEQGYNQRIGKGCVADYFRDQSSGMLNMAFDVYGPYQVSSKAQPYDNPTEKTRNYGGSLMREATNKWIAENPNLDYKQYDWNNNGSMNQLIFVYAGYTGNQSDEKSYGHIWPNTSSFTTITAPDGTNISNYTASAERWVSKNSNSYISCGIGTICHEFTHSLGLPDIYPTGSSSNLPYSMLDEWDLMDGGNFTNYGWCPPNYTALEKILMGWLTPVELTEPTTVSGLKPVDEGGQVYKIKHTNTEYLLLENRQWNGWDCGLPGKGLVIYHVNYNSSNWRNNAVNNTMGQFGFDIFHADNMDYTQWNDFLLDSGVSSQYANTPRLHNLHLSGSSYPWTDSSTETVNRDLTDTSLPAATMINANAQESKLLGKPITNIVMADDGTVSFDFMGGDGTVVVLPAISSDAQEEVFDLQGRSVSDSRHGQILLVRQKNGTFKKIIKK